MDKKIEEVKLWATERELYSKGDSKTQFIKLTEELGELGRGILKEDINEIVDAIGDITVVLINLTEIINREYFEETGLDLDLETCLQMALDEIRSRKGKMINGTFVKE